MDDALRVELPAELADELIADGFDEFLSFRGSAEAVTILSVASASLAAGANVATILIAREQTGRFLTGLRHWIRRKAASQVSDEVKIDISVQAGGRTRRLRIQLESSDDLSDTDVELVTASLPLMFDQILRAADTDVTPAPG